MPFFKTIKDGFWNDPEVWDLGRVPEDGDKIAVFHRLKLHPDQTPLTGVLIEMKSPVACLDLNGVKATAISSQLRSPGSIAREMN